MERLYVLFKEAKADDSLGAKYFEEGAAELAKETGSKRIEDMAKYITDSFDNLDARFVESMMDDDDDDDEGISLGRSRRSGQAEDASQNREDEDEEEGGAEEGDGEREDQEDRSGEDAEEEEEEEEEKAKKQRDLGSRANASPENGPLKQNGDHEAGRKKIKRKSMGFRGEEEETMALVQGLSPQYRDRDLVQLANDNGFSATVFYEGHNYAIMKMEDKETRDDFIKKCNRKQLLNQSVDLSPLNERKQIFVGNLPKRMDKEDLERDLEEEGGRFDKMTLKIGYGFVTYATGLRAHEACRKLRKATIEGLSLTAEFAKPGQQNPAVTQAANADTKEPAKELFVKGFGPKTTSEDLGALFGKHGKVEEARIAVTRGGRKRDFAFIRFERKEGATAALRALKDKECLGGALHIDYCIPDSKGEDLRNTTENRRRPRETPSIATLNDTDKRRRVGPSKSSLGPRMSPLGGYGVVVTFYDMLGQYAMNQYSNMMPERKRHSFSMPRMGEEFQSHGRRSLHGLPPPLRQFGRSPPRSRDFRDTDYPSRGRGYREEPVRDRDRSRDRRDRGADRGRRDREYGRRRDSRSPRRRRR